MQDYELLSETVDYENPYFQILKRHYRLPDGSEHDFFVRREVDTCCVLAMIKEGKFIFEKEFRVGPGERLHQLPAGRLEGFDDDPDERIKQELLEETGYSGTFKKIGAIPTSPYSTRIIHCYYATDCEKVAEPQLDEGEIVEVELVDQAQMEQILLSGKSSSCPPGLLAWEHLKKDNVIS